MKFCVVILLLISAGCFSQNLVFESQAPKGDHFLIYNKCLSPITFCEITQQSYTICGSTKNCYGLYVMPGDTFYLHIEDKIQTEVISADIFFNGYLSATAGYVFQPVDNSCMPPHALEIIIPLAAVPGSSFQITAQNLGYINSLNMPSGIPLPFDIYVGGQQPQFTFALSDFTFCPYVEQVSVDELKSQTQASIFYPNPSDGKVSLMNLNLKNYTFELYDLFGAMVFRQIEQNSKIVDLSELPNGCYTCKLIVNNKISLEKLVLLR
jgi:hypothetical protein